jgi:putative ABC transport system permease protein
MDRLLGPARYALRALMRSPGFAATAVVTLALGIGASTAIFSLVNAVMLRPLSFHDPDALVLVWGDNPQSGWPQLPLSYPNFSDARARARTVEDMAAWIASPDRKLSLSGGSDPEELQYAAATGNLFTVLGVGAARGRLLATRDDSAGSPPVVVLSHALWLRRFGADSAVVGSEVHLDGVSYHVVGVLPADFNFVGFPRSPDLWLPLAADPAIGHGNRSVLWARGAAFLGVIARLKPGNSLTMAQQELADISTQLHQENRELNPQWSLSVVPLRQQLARGSRTGLLLLAAAVACVLLIACANIAGLLFARAVARQRDIGIRVALGATRVVIVWQLLCESLLLALAGGAAGLLVAMWIVAIPAELVFGAPSPFVPFALGVAHVHIDWRVLLFTFLVSAASAVIFGLLPALRATRADHRDLLRMRAPSGAPQALRARDTLVVAEIALSLLVLTSAGILGRGLARLRAVDLGLNPNGVLTANVTLPRGAYADPARVVAFESDVLRRLRTTPGVVSAAAVEKLPLTGPAGTTDFRIENAPPPRAGDEPTATYGAATEGYFGLLGIALLSGRDFDERDDARAPQVAVVSDAFARRFWPGEEALGRRFALSIEALRFGPDGPPHLDFPSAYRMVVGVVSDVRRNGVTRATEPEVYLPFAQRPQREMTLVVRTRGEPLSVTGALRDAVRSVDAAQPVSQIVPMQTVVDEAIGDAKARTVLFALFASIGVVLAAVGLYGLVAFSVAQRRRDLAMRMALGAPAAQIIRNVVIRGLVTALIGVALGAVGARLAQRALQALLADSHAADGATLLVAIVVMLAVATLASYLPARRIARLDPMEALRSE